MMWWRRLRGLALAATIAVPTGAAAQSLLDKLLRVSGLTASPTQLRSPNDASEAGNIWIVRIDTQAARALTTEGGYRSPVFSPVGAIYALKGDAVVHIPPEGGAAVVSQRVSGVIKLVGFDGDSPDEIVVLLDGAAGSPLGVVSLKSGRIAPLPYDAKSRDADRILTQVRGQDRVYGDTRIHIETESKRGLARNIEWTDVYLRRGNAAPQNVSGCDGVNCVQPALSPDGRSIAFVKTEAR